MENKTAFVSGHMTITEEEFGIHYIPVLNRAMEDNDLIIMGDCSGTDTITMKYLKSKGYKKVIVFHMLNKARNNHGFNTMPGFTNDNQRDSAMTDASDYDIAWVRPGRKGSGTDQNLERRNNPDNTYIQDCKQKNHKITKK